MPALPALSGREVVRVFVAKGTPRSLIRAANVTVEELLAVRWTRSRPATAPDPRDPSRQRSRTNVLEAIVPTRTMLLGAAKEELLLMPPFVPNGRSTMISWLGVRSDMPDQRVGRHAEPAGPRPHRPCEQAIRQRAESAAGRRLRRVRPSDRGPAEDAARSAGPAVAASAGLRPATSSPTTPARPA